MSREARSMNRLALLLCLAWAAGLQSAPDGIARASGRVMLVDAATRSSLGVIPGFGDLSHASVVFSDDEHYAYIFGRDGGLSKLDLRGKTIVKRIVQAGNSI